MALAVGVAGPLGSKRAVGGIGSIRSSWRAPRPLAARKAGVSEKRAQGRCCRVKFSGTGVESGQEPFQDQ